MITPHFSYPELAEAVGVKRIFLKREDLHPYGSHKGRSIPIMIDIKVASGAKRFALSSSGNAAFAAIKHIRKLNAHGLDVELDVFIGNNINPEKKQRLIHEIGSAKVKIIESLRPLQALFNLIKDVSGSENKVISLRQSTDPDALVGYQSLANELALIPDISDVFIPVSSGTSAQAIAESFINNHKKVAVHIVQTDHNSPISSEFDKDMIAGDTISIADAIVDKTAYRKDELVKCVKNTGGCGWTVNNEYISKAKDLIKEKTGIEVTGNGALALAGLLKAKSRGTEFKGSVVCIITGK